MFGKYYVIYQSVEKLENGEEDAMTGIYLTSC